MKYSACIQEHIWYVEYDYVTAMEFLEKEGSVLIGLITFNTGHCMQSFPFQTECILSTNGWLPRVMGMGGGNTRQALGGKT